MSIKLHRHLLAGHSHCAQLARSLMGLPHGVIEDARRTRLTPVAPRP